MKTSNKIIAITVALIALNIFYKIYSDSSQLRKERNKKIELGGEIATRTQMFDQINGVMFKGNFDVKLIPDKYNKLEIEADKNILPLIHADKRGERYNIILNNDIYNKGTNRAKINFHFMKLLYVFGVDSKIVCDSIIKKENLFDDYLMIDCYRSEMNLSLDINSLELKAEENSKCILTGKAALATIKLSKNSDVEAKNFIIDECILSAKNNSNASLNVSKSLLKYTSDNSKYTLTDKTIKILENTKE